MRQTMKEIEVNVAYRWFLGLDMYVSVPHFYTFGKNYTRGFKDTDLFEQIFGHILEQCMKYKIAAQEALWYEEDLQKEINADREHHGKSHSKTKTMIIHLQHHQIKA